MMTTEVKIDRALAIKVLEVVDAGLVSGMGKPIPGQMCVEAAVCYAMGLPHSDEPTCVAPSLRALKIKLNDSSWSSNAARTKGLRRLAIAQLGSQGALDEKRFAQNLVSLVIRKYVPIALRAAASRHPKREHKDALEAAAKRCETEVSKEAALNARDVSKYADASASASASASADASAYASAYASADASASAKFGAVRDGVLGQFAEDVVSILIEMKAPGCEFLDLTEQVAA